jgi:hypothetical protein
VQKRIHLHSDPINRAAHFFRYQRLELTSDALRNSLDPAEVPSVLCGMQKTCGADLAGGTRSSENVHMHCQRVWRIQITVQLSMRSRDRGLVLAEAGLPRGAPI